VTPEAADYLSKARDDLNDARKIAAIGLAKVAARAASQRACLIVTFLLLCEM
jgi:hypothetical protein